MEKKIKEGRIKELNSRKKWEKIDNGFWFMVQTFMLSMGLDVAIAFFIRGLGLEIKTTLFFPLACWMLVIMFQTIYMVTKQHTENVKEIDDKYKNLIDKID
jgi:predicted peroxiredoxin